MLGTRCRPGDRHARHLLGLFPPQQRGAQGKIARRIVNHNANPDGIYISTDDPTPICPSMVLRTNDPNVSATSFKTLYAYLLTSKLTEKTLDFCTDLSYNLFRLEIIG
jgi:hypothetical protein